jgi:anti-sigma regulatory factor (Ser/Thr protein kinase)
MGGEPARRTTSGRTLRLVTNVPQVDSEDTVEESVLSLTGQRRSVAAGRHWVVREAAERGVTGMANQVVELLTSELIANAVLHGPPGGNVVVRLGCSETVVRVTVSDREKAVPVVLHPDPIEPSGRGMAIVEAMSNRWGVDAEAGGKSVWFELELDEF